MRFVIDAQLPPALAKRFRQLGHDAEHVHEIDLGTSADTEIWQYSASVGAVLVSKDQDFALMRIRFPDGPPVIWVRLGNVRRLELLRRLNAALPGLVAAIERGEMFIEIWD